MLTTVDRYENRGVSSSKSELHKLLKKVQPASTDLELDGAFCRGQLFDFANLHTSSELNDNGKYKKTYFFHHADGAGSKPILAYLLYKEMGDIYGFGTVARDAMVMNTDDLLCVGGLDNFSMCSMVTRNKFRIDAAPLETIFKQNHAFIDFLQSFGIGANLAGGETADVGETVSTLLVDATVTTMISEQDVIHPKAINPGNLIVGLASFGQATYEKEYNSGISANGITSAKHDVLNKSYLEKYPETIDKNIDSDLLYAGDYQLSDPIELTEKDFALRKTFPKKQVPIHRLLLSPTRTFLPIFKTIQQKGLLKKVTALFHNTGGGLTKCLRFSNGLHYVKDNLFDFPLIFRILQEKNSFREMFSTFNCGQRMEVLVGDQQTADDIIAICQHFDVAAKVIGRVEKNADSDKNNKLTISHQGVIEHFQL